MRNIGIEEEPRAPTNLEERAKDRKNDDCEDGDDDAA